jgi:hypothetical protein
MITLMVGLAADPRIVVIIIVFLPTILRSIRCARVRVRVRVVDPFLLRIVVAVLAIAVITVLSFLLAAVAVAVRTVALQAAVSAGAAGGWSHFFGVFGIKLGTVTSGPKTQESSVAADGLRPKVVVRVVLVQ